MWNRVTTLGGGAYQRVPAGEAQNNQQQQNQASARDDIEGGERSILHLPIKQGNYPHNARLLREIFETTSNKTSRIKEIGRKEGVDLAIDINLIILKTALIIYTTIYIMSKIPDAKTLLMNEAKNSLAVQELIGSHLDNPEFHRELAMFLGKTQAVAQFALEGAAAIGIALIITQAVSSAINQLGESLGTFLKVLAHPHEGMENTGLLMQLALRKIKAKVNPAIAALPKDVPEIARKAREKLQELEGQINQLNNPNVSHPPKIKDIEETAEILFAYFSLPLESEDLWQMGLNGNTQKAEDFNAKIKALAESYDEPMASQLHYLMLLYRYATLNPAVGDIYVFFKGPTYTGKTYFVEQFAEICRIPLRKMTIYEYVEACGNGVHDKKMPFWEMRTLPLLDALGAWGDVIQSATTRNAINLMDEVKLCDTGDGMHNLDAVDSVKKSRNSTNIPKVPRLDVPFKLREISFFISNYEMELPVPKKEAKPGANEKIKQGHEAFVRSFIHVEFSNVSPEKFKERTNKKVDAFLKSMEELHRPELIIEARRVFDEALTPTILKEAARHNPSKEETRITGKEVDLLVKKLGLKLAMQLDLLRKAPNLSQAQSSAGIELRLNEETVEQLKQVIIDDFNEAASRSIALQQAPAPEGKGKEKAVEGDEDSDDNESVVTSKDVLPKQTTEEIVAEMQAKIAELEKKIEKAEQEREQERQEKLALLIAQAIGKVLRGETGEQSQGAATPGRRKSSSELVEQMHQMQSSQSGSDPRADNQ